MVEDHHQKKKAKAIIVGGSIAGVSCAHALTSIGWEVVVLEKTGAPPTWQPNRCRTGAGPFVSNAHYFMARQSPAPPPGHLAPHYRSEPSNRWCYKGELNADKR